MKRLLSSCCAWLLAAAAAAAAPDRNLYVLGVALNQRGDAGAWEQVGQPGAWKATVAGVVYKDQLYTVESSGVLYATNLGTGEWKPIGKPDFAGTAFLFTAGDKLYAVEKDGGLYRVDPGDGARERVGKEGAWKATKAGVVVKDQLYVAETDGKLRAAPLDSDKRKQVGKAEFDNTTFMFTSGGKIYTIEGDGSFYRVDPGDGSWERVGKEGAWKAAKAGAVLDGRLYTAEAEGGLFATDLAAGERKQVGAPEFGNTAFMFAAGEKLYTIETDGNLYRVNAKPAKNEIDAYNWCPEEVEKVFREQGKPFYRDIHVKQVLGKDATHAGIMGGLAWLREKADKKDLVVIYIGCHGFTDPKEGWGAQAADGKVLWGREVKAELGKLPCPVLALVETCTSGGFAAAHANDPPLPDNVSALCACQAKQETDNQLDIAVAEALYGRADFNHDGVVDLDELIRYVGRRYDEYWPEKKKAERMTPVLVKAKDMPGSLALTKPSPELAAVALEGGYWSALLEKQDGDKCRVHLLGWSSKPGPYFVTNTAARDRVCLPSDGAPLLVEQNGTWYPARLLGREGEKIKVHYLGYNEDEVVAKERVKYPFVGRAEEEKKP
jgi:hypothetical protein